MVVVIGRVINVAACTVVLVECHNKSGVVCGD